MNWRRGAVLALVNVLAAGAVMIQLAVVERDRIKERSAYTVSHVDKHEAESTGQDQQVIAIPMSPCGWTDNSPREGEPIIMGNMPAEMVTGWGNSCPPRQSLAGVLGIQEYWVASSTKVKRERAFDVCMLALIALQWLVLGAIPTLNYKTWRREPGAFITICTVIGTVLVLIPYTRGFGRFFAIVAWLYWLAWLVIGLYAAVRKSWTFLCTRTT